MTTYGLELYRGDTYQRAFVLWLDTAMTQPDDLTDATARAQVRRTPAATDVMLELVCTIVLPNTIQVGVTPAGWVDAGEFCEGVWDLELTYADGRVLTYVAGPVRVLGDVTRAA